MCVPGRDWPVELPPSTKLLSFRVQTGVRGRGCYLAWASTAKDIMFAKASLERWMLHDAGPIGSACYACVLPKQLQVGRQAVQLIDVIRGGVSGEAHEEEP